MGPPFCFSSHEVASGGSGVDHSVGGLHRGVDLELAAPLLLFGLLLLLLVLFVSLDGLLELDPRPCYELVHNPAGDQAACYAGNSSNDALLGFRGCLPLRSA
jgi:hypothetical protein